MAKKLKRRWPRPLPEVAFYYPEEQNVMAEESYNLRNLADHLAAAFPQVEALYLFGSRRYHTGSPRSDVDVLVELAHGTQSGLPEQEGPS